MTDTITINGQPQAYSQPQTVLQLLQSLKAPVTGVAVAVNDRIIPKSHHAELQITAGDRVEIVHAVGGG
ncbi:MAG: thiamine biosynthesis protein ThiS [Deltaproteobacteria bacterium CG11_big_fil_rev_8_21_14_0_20_47_16]|nr:MAG: thiamine biosynthesis protein ThiS [Deltaproteobacteria bacterium CG11_big_fil_rev_8_21_14_0_20_47_16]